VHPPDSRPSYVGSIIIRRPCISLACRTTVSLSFPDASKIAFIDFDLTGHDIRLRLPQTWRPSETLLPILESKIRPDSIVFTDSFRAYDVLDISDFHHVRINHAKLFAADRNHINGIDNFWNQAKRHLRRYNGIPRHQFHLYLKECEWRQPLILYKDDDRKIPQGSTIAIST
jgi:transposase-like protein